MPKKKTPKKIKGKKKQNKRLILSKKRLLKKPLKKKSTPKEKPGLKKKAPAAKKVIKSVAGGGPILLKQPEGLVIGKITHFYPHVNAAVIKVKSPLKIGDTIRIKGHTTDFTETINSMQINRVSINEAKKGDEIGLLVSSRVRNGDIVYRV